MDGWMDNTASDKILSPHSQLLLCGDVIISNRLHVIITAAHYSVHTKHRSVCRNRFVWSVWALTQF